MKDLQDVWIAAWQFAARSHNDQKMAGGELPYLVHLGQVAMEVLFAHQLAPFAQPELAVQCALLHDTLEDTKVTELALRTQFGPAVAEGVLALTKSDALPKAEAMTDSLRRIRSQPREVWAVKLADRITNLGVPPAHWNADKIDTYLREARQILAELGTSHAPLAERLSRKIASYPPSS